MVVDNIIQNASEQAFCVKVCRDPLIVSSSNKVRKVRRTLFKYTTFEYFGV